MTISLYRRLQGTEGAVCRLVAVGDIMLSGEVARRHGPGSQDLFAEVAPLFRAADVVFGNVESPLCDGPRDLFRARPDVAPLLREAGFTVLSLANNHVLDYGPSGLEQCRRVLQAAGLSIVGAGSSRAEASRPVLVERGGVRVGILGYARTLQRHDPSGPCFAEWDETQALAAVRELKARVDCVVVSLHIGMMWLDYPNPAFKAIGDRLMDAGADLVLMHHAHVLQGYGVRGGRMTVYNLGNFIADIDEGETTSTPVPERQRESAAFVFELDRAGLAAAGVVPLWISDDYRVTLADGERSGRIVTRLRAVAEAVAQDRYRDEYARQRAELNADNLVESLLVKIRAGRWRELARNVLRARPEHLRMIGRLGVRKLGGLLRRAS